MRHQVIWHDSPYGLGVLGSEIGELLRMGQPLRLGNGLEVPPQRLPVPAPRLQQLRPEW
jgi:hypothetical protein